MGLKRALASGTVLSLAASAVWSLSALLAIGTCPLPRFGRSLPADYAALAAAPTGSGPGLFALTAAAYALCFFAAGLRARRRAVR